MRRGRRGALALAVLALGLVLLVSPAAAAPAPALHLVRVGTADQPTSVVALPGTASDVVVTEKPGRIVVLRHDGSKRLFADLSARVKSDGYEQGLLSVGFSPRYARDGKVYVFYTAPVAGVDRGSDLVISELRARHGRVVSASEHVILRIPHRLDENENGGQLVVAPDGELFIGTGDGGGDNDPYNNAQRLDPATNDARLGHDARLGKILRISPEPGEGCGGQCAVPFDHPHRQPEVWAYGLRNPWRFWFDDAEAGGGLLYLADVGNHAYEEIDVALPSEVASNGNFGWPSFEGAHATARGAALDAACCVAPALELPHGDDMNAVVGGVVARDHALPALEGKYLYASTMPGRIHAVDLRVHVAIRPPEPGPLRVAGTEVRSNRDTGLALPAITSFGLDGCGRVYATSLQGDVVRLAQSGACHWPHVAGGAPPTYAGWPKGWVHVVVACGFACRATVSGKLRIDGPGGGSGRTTTRSVTLAEGAQRTVHLRLPRRLLAAARRALRDGRAVRVRGMITARYAGGRVDRRAFTTNLVN